MRAAKKYLVVRCDATFRPLKRQANCAEFVILRTIDVRDCRCFRQSVAFKDEYPQSMKELADILGQRALPKSPSAVSRRTQLAPVRESAGPPSALAMLLELLLDELSLLTHR